MAHDFIYAGIGSRETPDDFMGMFSRVAHYLEYMGGLLHSGGADGADAAFEAGVQDPKNAKIFLPWKGFNGSNSSLYVLTEEAYVLARYYHPRFDKLSDPVKKLMARNTYQVLGEDTCTPVDFVICWTRHGRGEGGTGQALRIAADYAIPVFDAGIYPTAEAARRPLYEFIHSELIRADMRRAPFPV